MNSNVSTAILDWKNTADTAKQDLAVLESTLKQNYNNYIDSLAAYLEKIKTANLVRSTYINTFESDDLKNGSSTRNNFLYSADPPIENEGPKYILDNSTDTGLRNSYELVRAADTQTLLSKKVQ